MPSNKLPVTADQTYTDTVETVSGAYGGSGNAISVTSQTAYFQIRNYTTSQIEYRIASGAWVTMPIMSDVTVDADLSTTTVRLRRSLTGAAVNVVIRAFAVPGAFSAGGSEEDSIGESIVDSVISPYSFGAKGDGATDDTAALNSWLAACAAAGKAAILPAAEFAYSTPLTANCSIVGSGPLSVLKHVGANGKNSRIECNALTDKEFRDFTVWAPNSTGLTPVEDDIALRITDGLRVTVRGMRFRNLNGACVLMRRCADSSVTNNVFEGCWKDTIHITGGVASGHNSITIANNVIEDGGDDCIAVVGYTGDTYHVGGVTITGNVINGSKFARGIAVVGGHHVNIIGNIVRNPAAAGIYIASESSFSTRAPSDVNVIGNQLIGCGNLIPDHGVIHFSTYTGFPVKNVKIANNIIDRAANNGVFGGGVSGTPVENVEIVHNTFKNCGTDPDGKVGVAGTLARGGVAPNQFIKDWTISHNHFSETGSAAIFVPVSALGVLRVENNTGTDINKNGAASTDFILITAGSTADVIYCGGNALLATAYTVERLVENNNPTKTVWTTPNYSLTDRAVISGNASAAVTLTGSPFTYQNNKRNMQRLSVQGGTVSLIEYSRDNTNWYSFGQTSGVFVVEPISRVRVTYSSAPTVTEIPFENTKVVGP